MPANILKTSVVILFFLVLQFSCTTQHHSSKKESSTITKPRNNGGGMNSDIGDNVTEDFFREEEKADELMMDDISLELEEGQLGLKDKKAAEDDAPSPKRDEFLSKKENTKAELPPAQVFRVRFKIKNNNNQAVWYIMPYQGAVSLPENGRFERAEMTDNLALEVGQYNGLKAGTQLLELRFTGKDQQHFRAFYIPAKSSFTLSNYTIDCWQGSEKVELWAVKEMHVNNERFLQDCLPFSPLSSTDVVVRCSKDKGCPWELVEWDNALQNASAEMDLDFIQAQKVKKYSVQLSK